MFVVVRVRVLREEKLEGAFFDWIFVLADECIMFAGISYLIIFNKIQK